MRETPNLLLKLPDPNDYVLVEDLNENFTTIDTEIAKITDPATGVEAKLTKHLDENTIGAHKASNISFAPPTNMTSTNLQLAVVEAFQFGNSRKNELVDLLLSLDDSLQINYSSSWQEIYAEAANVSTGKKWARGVASVGASTQFRDFNGSSVNASIVTVSGLDFKPNTVFLYAENLANIEVGAISLEMPIRANGFVTFVSGVTHYRLTENAKMENSGFSLPAPGAVATAWVAFE